MKNTDSKVNKAAKKSKKALASEMLEIGSDATLTAGDLIVEEEDDDSFFTSNTPISPGSSRPTPVKQKAFFPEDRNKTKKAGETTGAKDNTNAKKEFLNSKLLEADSSSDDEEDGESAVSNLTDPSVFHQNVQQVISAVSQDEVPFNSRRDFGRDTEEKTVEVRDASPSNSRRDFGRDTEEKTVEVRDASLASNHAVTTTPKQKVTKSPPAVQPEPSKKSLPSISKQNQQSNAFESGPSFSSWGELSSANYTRNNAALGRALDMKLTSPESQESSKKKPLALAMPSAEATTPSNAAASSKVSTPTSASLPKNTEKASSLPTPSFMKATSASRNGRAQQSESQPKPLSPSARQKKARQMQMKATPGRTTSPMRRGASGSGNTKEDSPAGMTEWSKLKDNMIEQRVAESKKATTNLGTISNEGARFGSRSQPISKASAMKKIAVMRQQQQRSSSATPAARNDTSATAARPQSTSRVNTRQPSAAARNNSSATTARSQSASRVNTRQSSPFRRNLRRMDRTRTNNSVTDSSVQKLEPLTKVMSSVPSSLASRGPSDSIELRRMASELSFAGSSGRARSVSSSRAKDSIELKRQQVSTSRTRAASAARRNQSPARNSSKFHKKLHEQHQSPPRASKPSLSEGTGAATNRFPTSITKLRSMARAAKNEPKSKYEPPPRQHQAKTQLKYTPLPKGTPNRSTYVPMNAYAGRFTPQKKKKDKISEIMAIKEQETKEEMSISSSAISRKHGKRSREAGAKKLKNMIKLKNHFASDGASAASSSILPSVAPDWKSSFRTTFSYRSNNTSKQDETAVYESSILPALFKRQPIGPPRKADKMTMLRERGLIDSFSVGGASDLHSIRSSLQSRHDNDYLVEYSRYDIDPMYKAELRLMGSSVIPIQAAARRFLARKEALSHLWAALVIQARWRAFYEQIKYETKIYAITRIQAVVRGMLARDHLMFEDYCATEIQRHVRGYFAAMLAYDTVYRISLIQSLVRKRQAMHKATVRMYCVIKLQGLARGYLMRLHVKKSHKSATTIQRCVRGYLTCMRVFEEIYKITLIQSCVRRRRAKKKAGLRMSLASSIQALARGYLVRCRLDMAHYHATTIQRYTRGYLGTLRVFEEIYKIILIQNFVRMKMAINKATMRMTMIIKIQADWRRYCVMRRMEYAHFNATEIQRCVRGYLTTMAVYEELYKITIIQNIFRMKKARAIVVTRKKLVFQTQAIVRGFILRTRLCKIRQKAVTIQTAWRCFYYRMIYQFNLLDIIIAQSVWRRKKAHRVTAEKRHIVHTRAVTVIQTRWRCYDAHMTYLQFQIENRAATMIQAQWRCYDTSMDYLHYLADVLIVQSMVRRWFALRRVTRIVEENSIVVQRIARGFLGRLIVKKTKAAIQIQKTWKGFVTFADYMFTIADIVIVQTAVRRRIAIKKANYLRHKIEHDAATVLQKWRRREIYRREYAATMIQKIWRGLVLEAEFTVAIYEYRTARTIQAYWRRFWKFSNYLICLDCSIRIQAVVRGFLARCKFADKQWGAVILQAAARRVIAKRRVASRKMVLAQAGTSYAIGALQSMAATVIQSTLRGYQGRRAQLKYVSARLIQAHFRGSQERVLYKHHAAARMIQKYWRRFAATLLCIRMRAAIKIQKHARGMIYFCAYTRFLAARCIQNSWRCAKSRSLSKSRSEDYHAATAIQTTWRGYFLYTNYLFALCDIVQSQSVVRMYLGRKKFLQMQRFETDTAAAIKVQAYARRFLARQRFLSHFATIIQKAWRRYFFSAEYDSALINTVKVQSCIRRRLARNELRRRRVAFREAAALVLQRTWRCYFCRTNYEFIVADVVKVQSEVRRFLAQKKFYDKWEDHAITCAIKIQARWRSYYAETNYLHTISDLIKIQSAARGFLATLHYIQMFTERRQLSTIILQRWWRSHRDQKAYRNTLYSACIIQRTTRRYQALKARELQAAIAIQTAWRSFRCYSEYFMKYLDIVKVQCFIRALIARKEYKKLCFVRDSRSACKLQAAYRGWTAACKFAKKKSAALDIQRYWRGFNGRVGLFVAWKQHTIRINKAAAQLQKLWRGYVQMQRYLYQLGSVIEIQSLARIAIVKSRCQRRQRAALMIQSARRVHLAKKITRSQLSKQVVLSTKQQGLEMRRAAIKIQSLWRVICTGKKAIAIQRFFKETVMKKKLSPEAKLERKRTESAIRLQRWYRFTKRVRSQRRFRAAATILRFLQMVKAEVDREIQNEIQRRQQKKETRRKNQQMEDAILETAWQKTSRTGMDIYRSKRRTTAASKGIHDDDGVKLLQDTLQDLQSRSRCGMYASSSPRSNNNSIGGALPSLLNMDSNQSVNDDSSVLSGLTGATTQLSQTTSRRPTPSRVKRFSPEEIDEEYFLEEAFLDAEIHSAKSRRQSEKRQKSRSSSRQRSTRSVGNASSVGSQRTYGSRRSVSTRESTRGGFRAVPLT